MYKTKKRKKEDLKTAVKLELNPGVKKSTFVTDYKLFSNKWTCYLSRLLVVGF